MAAGAEERSRRSHSEGNLIRVPLPLIEPLAPRKIDAPVDHPGVLWEIKHDGFRALLYVEQRRGRFISRTGRHMVRFQWLADRVATELRVPTAILDGEIVVLDEDGRSHFDALSRRDPPATLYAFDHIWGGGGDQRQVPLIQRKAAMQAIWSHGTDHMVIGGHVAAEGEALFAEVCRLDCEGIVGKAAQSPYGLVRGRVPWVKVLNPDYTQTRGRAEAFNRRR